MTRSSRPATQISPTGGIRSSTSSTRSDVRFAHEVHPSEIAYDYWSTVATLEAIGHRPGFGLNFDPSHMVWQDLDYVGFLWDFRDRIYHVDCKDTKIRMNNGRNGRLVLASAMGGPAARLGFHLDRSRRHPLGGHLPDAQPHRLRGPISIEWEDAGMDRLDGAPEALDFIRSMNGIRPSEASFDAAFATRTRNGRTLFESAYARAAPLPASSAGRSATPRSWPIPIQSRHDHRAPRCGVPSRLR